MATLTCTKSRGKAAQVVQPAKKHLTSLHFSRVEQRARRHSILCEQKHIFLDIGIGATGSFGQQTIHDFHCDDSRSLFKSAQAYRPVFVADRHFHMVNSRLCLVCRNHRGRSRRLCRLCNQYRACPGCIPERCWIAFQGADGACRDCFISFVTQSLNQRLSLDTIVLVVKFL